MQSQFLPKSKHTPSPLQIPKC